jgi:hypothetical protein
VSLVKACLEKGGVPKQTIKKTLKALNNLGTQMKNPLKVIAVLQANIPAKFLECPGPEQNSPSAGKREVILSMVLAGE